ncbi:MAG: hypothetical protein ACK5TK_04340 [Betaproteobacteria bacterium]
MKKRLFVWLMAVASFLLLTSAPARAAVDVVSWLDVPATTLSGEPATVEQIRKAFLVGGARRGWQFVDDGPGKLVGTVIVRSHTLKMQVEIAPGKYSLRYLDSVNLDYEVVDGKPRIHRSYERWNAYLQQEVRAELLRL